MSEQTILDAWLESQDFYELCQRYRQAGNDPADQVESWTHLKQAILAVACRTPRPGDRPCKVPYACWWPNCECPRNAPSSDIVPPLLVEILNPLNACSLKERCEELAEAWSLTRATQALANRLMRVASAMWDILQAEQGTSAFEAALIRGRRVYDEYRSRLPSGDGMSAGRFHCACVFSRPTDFSEAALVSECAFHSARPTQRGGYLHLAVKMRKALEQCVRVCQQWHGDDAFDLYFNHSPEMKLIRDALGKMPEKS